MPPIYELERVEEYMTLLRERLPEKTFRHSISAAEWADAVAEACGVDQEKAATAALLHDIEKGLSGKELLKLAKDMGLDISKTQQEKPKLLHGFVGAEECRNLLGIEDEGILEAIRWHTTGLPGLGSIGLVVFFVDFSEPLREYPEAVKARRLFEHEGLLEALRFVAMAKLTYARSKPPLDPNTEAFGNWLHRIPMLPGVAK